jgi:hypothetical protein
VTRFSPKAALAEGQQGIPPSDYLVAIRRIVERKQSQRSKDYLIIQVQVIAGAARDKRFRDTLSLDLTSDGAKVRLAILLQECGHTDEIDIDSDEEIESALVDRPFKARVERKVRDGYTDNTIARVLTGAAVSADDRRIMDEWVANAALEDSFDRGRDDRDVPPPGDDDIAGRGYRGGGGDPDVPF